MSIYLFWNCCLWLQTIINAILIITFEIYFPCQEDTKCQLCKQQDKELLMVEYMNVYRNAMIKTIIIIITISSHLLWVSCHTLILTTRRLHTEKGKIYMYIYGCIVSWRHISVSLQKKVSMASKSLWIIVNWNEDVKQIWNTRNVRSYWRKNFLQEFFFVSDRWPRPRKPFQDVDCEECANSL